MHCTNRLWFFLLALALSDTGLAEDAFWRGAAQEDLAAIRDIIARDHPVMAPSLGDVEFQALERRSDDAAKDLVAKVTSEEGYRAALRFYTVGLADKHIKVRFQGGRERFRWPGFLTERRAGRFVIGYSETAEVAVGDVLLSCDGRPAEDIAQMKLGRFHANWRIEAQRIAKAPYLFIDIGNPFVEPWSLCTFLRQEDEIEVDLTWGPISENESFKDYTRSLDASSTFDIRRMGKAGYWIRLPLLNDRARELVDRLQGRREDLRQAPFVIVDVRGNSGGNSRIGDDLASLLGLKPKPLRFLVGKASAHWRASEENAEAVRSIADTLGERFGISEERRQAFRREARQIAKAAASGKEFFPDLPVIRPVLAPSEERLVSIEEARVFLLTDHACFSSCLMMTTAFRQAGAAHIGTGTDADTRFTEVSERSIPSGRAVIQIQQRVLLHRPAWEGPYKPVAVFPGDIRDDRSVEAWVMSLVAER